MTDLQITYLAPGDKEYRDTLQAIQKGAPVPPQIKENFLRSGKVYPG